jgi:hypothetical protein
MGTLNRPKPELPDDRDLQFCGCVCTIDFPDSRSWLSLNRLPKTQVETSPTIALPSIHASP